MRIRVTGSKTGCRSECTVYAVGVDVMSSPVLSSMEKKNQDRRTLLEHREDTIESGGGNIYIYQKGNRQPASVPVPVVTV